MNKWKPEGGYSKQKYPSLKIVQVKENKDEE